MPATEEFNFPKKIELGLKWVHMAQYGVILRLDGALWLRIILKPLLTPKGAIKCQIPGNMFSPIFVGHIPETHLPMLDFPAKSNMGEEEPP